MRMSAVTGVQMCSSQMPGSQIRSGPIAGGSHASVADPCGARSFTAKGPRIPRPDRLLGRDRSALGQFGPLAVENAGRSLESRVQCATKQSVNGAASAIGADVTAFHRVVGSAAMTVGSHGSVADACGARTFTAKGPRIPRPDRIVGRDRTARPAIKRSALGNLGPLAVENSGRSFEWRMHALLAMRDPFMAVS